jgi:hypothetical protein
MVSLVSILNWIFQCLINLLLFQMTVISNESFKSVYHKITHRLGIVILILTLYKFVRHSLTHCHLHFLHRSIRISTELHILYKVVK